MTDNIVRIDPRATRERRERFDRLMDMVRERSAAMQSDPQPFYDALARDYAELRLAVLNVLEVQRVTIAMGFDDASQPVRMETVTVPADDWRRYERTRAAIEALARRAGV